MADEKPTTENKPKTVKVEALQYHTHDGKAYQVGDTYDIDEQYADSVANQGKAVRVDRADQAKKQVEAAKKPAGDTAVKPMGTTDFHAPPKK